MTEVILASSLKCSTNTSSEITNALNGFFNKISTGLLDAVEIMDEISSTTELLVDAFSGFSTQLTTLLEDKLEDFLETALKGVQNFLFSKLSKLAALAQFDAFQLGAFKPISKLFDAFGCIGSTIKKAIGGTIKKLLENAVTKGFVNPVACAVEDFIGNVTAKITGVMDGIIGPLIAPINNLFSKIGQGFGSIGNALKGGLNILSKAMGLINCADGGGGKCHKQYAYKMNVGSLKPDSDSKKENFIVKGLKNATTFLENKTQKLKNINEGIDDKIENIETYGLFGENKETVFVDENGADIEQKYEISKENEKFFDSLIDKSIKDIQNADPNFTLPDQAAIDKQIKDWENLRRMLFVTISDKNIVNYPDGLDINVAIKNAKKGLFNDNSVTVILDDKENKVNTQETITVTKELQQELEQYLANKNAANTRSKQKESNYGFLKDADGNAYIPDCDAGNIFKCGLPKVEIFGGNGEGAVGEVIMGTFIEELDRAISETTYIDETLDKEIIAIRKRLQSLASKNNSLQSQIDRMLKENPARDDEQIKMRKRELENNKLEIEKLKKELIRKEEERAEKVNDDGVVETEIGGSFIEDIKETGSIIGVDITYPGEGYTEEPIVRFADNCDQGYGAFGRAVIDKDPKSPNYGKLTDIIMISVGKNYPIESQEDSFVNRIIVEDGGSGYKLEDTIEDFEICGVDENGSITKVCTNDKAYRDLPPMTINSITGSGAILKPIMTKIPRKTGVITVIDCITPKGNIVGYVNGKEYNGPFHVHPETGQKMVGIAHTTSPHAIIYNTPQDSLGSGVNVGSNVGSTQVNLRTIKQLLEESESTDTPPSSGGGY